MLSSLRSNRSTCTTGRSDLIANTFFAAIESDLLIAGAMAGVHGMLACLNARTRYRFTGICPVGQRGAAHAAFLYDRDLPGPTHAGDPELARIARAIAGAEPLAGTAEQMGLLPTTGAGVGAMLMGNDALPWGVLCHFDRRLRAAPPTELPLLRFLGERAPAWLEPRLHAALRDQPAEP